MLIYLAGPMTGLTYDEATAWRRETERRIPEAKFLDPVRFDTPSGNGFEHKEPAYDGMKSIIRRNYNDVAKCDLVFANFGAAVHKNISVGTVAEICWAYSLRIPSIMVVPGYTQEGSMDALRAMSKRPTTHYNHPYLKELADYVCGDFDEAIRVARTVLCIDC